MGSYPIPFFCGREWVKESLWTCYMFTQTSMTPRCVAAPSFAPDNHSRPVWRVKVVFIECGGAGPGLLVCLQPELSMQSQGLHGVGAVPSYLQSVTLSRGLSRAQVWSWGSFIRASLYFQVSLGIQVTANFVFLMDWNGRQIEEEPCKEVLHLFGYLSEGFREGIAVLQVSEPQKIPFRSQPEEGQYRDFWPFWISPG